MDSFEAIIALFLQEKGYWVRSSVKVDISKADKRKIGTHSMPRPEIDLVAYNLKANELLLIEAKSFLDSYGVKYKSLSKNRNDGGYKLLTSRTFRRIVSQKLKKHYVEIGLINKTTKINYALVAGNVYSHDENKIADLFKRKGWKFFSPSEIREGIKALSNKGWEDNAITLTTKLILRGVTQ